MKWILVFFKGKYALSKEALLVKSGPLTSKGNPTAPKGNPLF
jgi:hypothetical protein